MTLRLYLGLLDDPRPYTRPPVHGRLAAKREEELLKRRWGTVLWGCARECKTSFSRAQMTMFRLHLYFLEGGLIKQAVRHYKINVLGEFDKL